jgi:hypothetical protein
VADSIPDYYRHLAEREETSGDARADGSSAPEAQGDSAAPAADSANDPVPHRADAFRMMLPGPRWADRSIYTLTGPVAGGVQHNITINTMDDVEADSVYDFGAEELALVDAQLDGCQILMVDPIELDCGVSALRAIYFWYPDADLKLYQEQIYVLQGGRAYVLTASFTAATRKRLGPSVEAMMRSFTPRGSVSTT